MTLIWSEHDSDRSRVHDAQQKCLVVKDQITLASTSLSISQNATIDKIFD